MKMGYPLTQAEKREICAWKYEGEYAGSALLPEGRISNCGRAI